MNAYYLTIISKTSISMLSNPLLPTESVTFPSINTASYESHLSKPVIFGVELTVMINFYA